MGVFRVTSVVLASGKTTIAEPERGSASSAIRVRRPLNTASIDDSRRGGKTGAFWTAIADDCAFKHDRLFGQGAVAMLQQHGAKLGRQHGGADRSDIRSIRRDG